MLPACRHLELPGVAALVVQEARVVVAFVEVFEDAGKDFWELFGEVDSFGGALEELAAADGGEEGGCREYVFMRGEEALLGAHAECDNGGSQVAGVEFQSGIRFRSGVERLPWLRWILMLPRPFHFLRSCGLVSERSLLPARRHGLARTMLGEAVIVVGPPGKHVERLICARLQREALPGRRCGVLMREH